MNFQGRALGHGGRCSGPKGRASGLRGRASALRGKANGLRGRAGGLRGRASGLRGSGRGIGTLEGWQAFQEPGLPFLSIQLQAAVSLCIVSFPPCSKASCLLHCLLSAHLLHSSSTEFNVVYSQSILVTHPHIILTCSKLQHMYDAVTAVLTFGACRVVEGGTQLGCFQRGWTCTQSCIRYSSLPV